ncbi:MAG TPA: SigE family RNA polymerase sigma factor [Mycobacteriales bacterium]|nr:SigE family RNA polymerase sigma factor [Mycobacteriales bacterium]
MSPPADFDALYREGAPRLVRQLVPLVRDRQEAEDVVQEAWARAYSRWGAVGAYDAPEAWVRTVALRLAVSRWRRSRNALAAWRRSGAPEDLPGASPDAVALVRALRALPEAQRVAVVLHHLVDLPLEQVAAETGVPVGTVTSRLARGRAALAPPAVRRARPDRGSPPVPDRLTSLSADLEGLRVELAPADAVRRRGTLLRRRRQAAAGGGALAVVAAVVAGGVLLTGGSERLTAPPAAPAPSAAPQATAEPTPSWTPEPLVPAPAGPDVPPTAAAEAETSESDLGYVRGFGERDGRRTVLLDRVDLQQSPDGPTTLSHVNPRVREHVLADDVQVVLGDGDRAVRTQGELTETGSPAALDDLVAAFEGLGEGEELLVELALGDGTTVDAVTEMRLR